VWECGEREVVTVKNCHEQQVLRSPSQNGLFGAFQRATADGSTASIRTSQMVPQCFFRIYTSRRSRKKNSRSRNRSSPPIIMPSPSNARIMLVYSAGKSKYNTLRVYDELLEGANCAPYLCSSNLWKIDIKFRPQWSFESTNGQEDSTFT
jgi:hypothetical protein